MNKILLFFIILTVLILALGVGDSFFNGKLFVKKTPVEKNDTPIVINEKNADWEIDVQVEKAGQPGLDQVIENFVADRVANFKKTAQELRNVEHSFVSALNIKSKKYFFSETIQSLEVEIYEYVGGAHGNTDYKTWTFDKSGKLFSLTDLFQPEADVLETIFSLVQKKLSQQLQFPDEETIRRGTGKNNLENYSNFILDGNQLIFIFPPYQVAAYVEGTQRVSIPLTDLNKIIAPEFVQKDGK